MKTSIVDYSDEYHDDIKLLDDNSVQGNWIQLRMKKPAIHARANVFKEHHTILTLVKNEVVGYMSAAKTFLVINDQKHELFIGFDAKVKQEQRNKGIFKSMTTHMLDYYKTKRRNECHDHHKIK